MVPRDCTKGVLTFSPILITAQHAIIVVIGKSAVFIIQVPLVLMDNAQLHAWQVMETVMVCSRMAAKRNSHLMIITVDPAVTHAFHLKHAMHHAVWKYNFFIFLPVNH
jgi:hypothetical protein